MASIENSPSLDLGCKIVIAGLNEEFNGMTKYGPNTKTATSDYRVPC